MLQVVAAAQRPLVCSLGSNNATLEYLDLSNNACQISSNFDAHAMQAGPNLAIGGNPVSKNMTRDAYVEEVRKLCLNSAQ